MEPYGLTIASRGTLRQQASLAVSAPLKRNVRQHSGTPIVGKVVFNTERLVVRRWREDDLPLLISVYTDRDAMRWVADGNPISNEACSRWMEVTQNNYATRGYGMFAVETKSEAKVIGFCGLVHPGGQEDAEIKYAYLRSHWGQGFATEAAHGMLRYGTRCHGLGRILATTAPENTASHNVLVKAGMQRGLTRTNDDGSFTQLFVWQAGPSAA